MTSTPPSPPPQPHPTSSRSRPANTAAVVAFVIALVAFVFGCIPFVGFVSWLVAAAAIVIAIVAIVRPALPKRMAVAALIVGVVALIAGPVTSVNAVVAAVKGAEQHPLATEAAANPAQSTPASLPSDTPSDAPSAASIPTRVLNGRGDRVVKVDYEDPIVVKFSCTGCSGNTSVETDSGTDTLPVNTIGRYAGRFLLNAQDGDLLTKFVIKADSAWKLTITDPQNADLSHIAVGATLKGHGDDVAFVESGVTDSDVRNVGQGNFAITSYGGSDPLPVNEIGSYHGNVALDGPAVIQIKSDGDWSIKGNG